MGWEDRYLNDEVEEVRRAKRPDHYLASQEEWTGDSRARGAQDSVTLLYARFPGAERDFEYMMSGLLELKRPIYPKDQWNKLVEVLPCQAQSHLFKLWGIRAVGKFSNSPHIFVEVWGGSKTCDNEVEQVKRPNHKKDVGIIYRSKPKDPWEEVKSTISFRPVENIWKEKELKNHYQKFKDDT